MVSKHFPRKVWGFGLKHAAKVIHMIPSAKMNGRTPNEEVTGETSDISYYVDFDLCDLVWCHKVKHTRVSKETQVLGQWVVVARKICRNMSDFIIPIYGQPIAETTL